LVLALGSWFVLRARAKSTRDGDQPVVSNSSNNDPANGGRELRRMMLTMALLRKNGVELGRRDFLEG